MAYGRLSKLQSLHKYLEDNDIDFLGNVLGIGGFFYALKLPNAYVLAEVMSKKPEVMSRCSHIHGARKGTETSKKNITAPSKKYRITSNTTSPKTWAFNNLC